MTKTEIKHEAQAELMEFLAHALLVAEETGRDQAIIDEMRAQATRVGKMFGYATWAGIMVDGKPI